MLETPVLFVVFNRPDSTLRVFERIREAQPRHLFIAADGPRAHVESDSLNCERVRQIVSRVDWDCKVKSLYSEINLGFSQRIKTALEWYFNHVDAGIVLEDDCLPDISFFEFCQRTLQWHKDDGRLTLVAGSTFCDRPISRNRDYFIADFGYIWGWASWRSAFRQIRWQEPHTPEEIYKKIIEVYADQDYASHFISIIQDNYCVRDCWDVELFVYNLMHNKKNIFPNVNLISNIGASGTHYSNSDSKLLNCKTFSIDFKAFNVQNYEFLPPQKQQWVIQQFINKVRHNSFRGRLSTIKQNLLNILGL